MPLKNPDTLIKALNKIAGFAPVGSDKAAILNDATGRADLPKDWRDGCRHLQGIARLALHEYGAPKE